MGEQPFINAAAATQAAARFLREVYTGADAVRVEELELPDDDAGQAFWRVTLSYIDTLEPAKQGFSGIAQMVNPVWFRVYKVFDIDAKSGEVKRMKIRKVD